MSGLCSRQSLASTESASVMREASAIRAVTRLPRYDGPGPWKGSRHMWMDGRLKRKDGGGGTNPSCIASVAVGDD